ncbi:hypothetical protein V8C37DRAFT_406775 [Trichoderma ceciliae]
MPSVKTNTRFDIFFPLYYESHRFQQKSCKYGECGKLGLCLEKNVSLIRRLNAFLDPHGWGKIQVVQIAYGGMGDQRSYTEKNVEWDGDFRDLNTRSDDDDEVLNPYEPTVAKVSSVHFPLTLWSRILEVKYN